MFDPSAITIISGGQTGADRAALDFAIEHGIAHGGWCPCGRIAEDGVIDGRYALQETPTRRYSQRTEWNVRDSDVTVIFTIESAVSGGTSLTLACARRQAKPCSICRAMRCLRISMKHAWRPLCGCWHFSMSTRSAR